MTEFDKEYLRLLKEILNKGIEVENRTGINTIKIPEYSFKFDLSTEYPILMSKQTAFKSAVIEMLWIWQMMSNDVTLLHDRGVHIWDLWKIDVDGIYRIYEPNGEYIPDREVAILDPLSTSINNPFGILEPKTYDDGKVMMAKSLIPGKTIKSAKYYGKEYANTIGTAYGFITKRYDFIRNLIDTIKNNPNDRRMVKSLWQDEFLRTAVLPSCVWSTEWDVTRGKLNLSVHQRSCDTALGLPFNVTQYATLLKMIAQVTNLEVGTISYSIKDAHIYVNQINGINEQLRREKRYYELFEKSNLELLAFQKYLQDNMVLLDKNSLEYKNMEVDFKIIDIILEQEKPELWLNEDINDFFEFDNSKELKDIKIKKYRHMGKINFPLAQ